MALDALVNDISKEENAESKRKIYYPNTCPERTMARQELCASMAYLRDISAIPLQAAYRETTTSTNAKPHRNSRYLVAT